MAGWLDGLHLALDVVGTVASVVPGAGTAVAAVAEGLNATIYLAEAAVAKTPEARREALTQASISAVCMVPGAKLAKAASKGLAKATKGTKTGEKIVSAMAVSQKAVDKVTDMKNVVRSTKAVQAIETTVKKGLSKPVVGPAAAKLKLAVDCTEKTIGKLPGGKRLVSKSGVVKKGEGTLGAITKRRDQLPPKLRGALGDIKLGTKDATVIQAILASEKAIARKSAAALGKNILVRRSDLIKKYGPDAMRLISKLEAEYYRRAASNSLVHYGIPLARNLGTMWTKKAFPILDIEAGLVRYAWDKFAPLQGQSVAAARLEQATSLRQLVREGKPTTGEAGEYFYEVDTEELLVQLLMERMLEEYQELHGREEERTTEEKAEEVTEEMQAQWPSFDRQVYDFLTQMAGFLPPKYAPIANLVLKVGGVTAGLDSLTPEGLISTLLPFIKDATVQQVVGTALKVRALQQQVEGLNAALKAGTATTAAQLATLHSAMAVVSTILSLIPGIPPEVTQAVQLVTAVLQLAQLLSAAAPPLMVLSALASILQLGAGFGFGGKSKQVPGGTNNSGTGAPHSSSGGNGPSAPGDGPMPGEGGRGLASADGIPIDAPARDSGGDGPSMWLPEWNNNPTAFDKSAGGGERVAGGSDDDAVQDNNGPEIRKGKGGKERLPPATVAEMTSVVNHISNSLGLGDLVTSFEDESRNLAAQWPEEAKSIDREARRQMGLPPGRSLVDSDVHVEGSGFSNERAALHESEFPDIDDILSRRARGEAEEGHGEMTGAERTPGDEQNSDIFEEPGERAPDPCLSGDVSAAVASELALLGDEVTEDIFWAKLINSSLVSQSFVQNELLEAAEREEEEVRQREAESERQRQKALQEEAEARERHYRELEQAMSRAEREHREAIYRKRQEETAARLARDAEAQRLHEAKQARERAAREQQQRSTRPKKKGGCTLI